MNKIFMYLGGVLLSLSMLTSCNEALDMTPDGRISLDEVFADPEMAAKYMSNCYNNIPQKSHRYFWFQNYPIALSDEAWSTDDVNGQGPVLVYKGQGSASLNPLDHEYHDVFDAKYWEKYWQQIRTCNVMLERIGTATLNKEEDRSRWKGEAYTLRAYFYMELVKWYGQIPVIKQTLPLNYDYSQMKRESTVTVFKEIIDDCNKALETNMPWRITTTDEKWRVTKAVAMAIRSQAALYAASKLYSGGEDLWQWAYDINKDCYTQLKANGYELYTVAQSGNYPNAYAEYFSQNGGFSNNPVDKETIWQSQVSEEPYWYVWGTPLHNCYMAGESPSQQLVDAYDMISTGKPVLKLDKPYLDEQCLQPNYNEGSGFDEQRPYEGRDPRFYATVIYDGCELQIGNEKKIVETFVGGNCGLGDNKCSITRSGYYPRKGMHYNASPTTGGEDGRWKYFRLGEIYLNLAEAAIESGKTDEGLALINEIRHRAGFSPAVDVKASSKDEARLLLRHERQIELAYEEHRYFDARRWTASNENIGNEKWCVGMRITKDGDSKHRERFLIGTDGSTPSKMNHLAKWHFFPIPAAEAAKMEAITGDNWQNEGW